MLYKIYGDFSCIFLDEIQNIEKWPLFVNRHFRTKMHVVITGSNAKLLGSDLATHLTGRSCEINLYPFSFAKYCEMKGIDYRQRTTRRIANIRDVFDEYLQKDGFPELLKVKNGKNYIANLVDNILKRDIEQRYNIALPAQFENMAHHLLNIAPYVVQTSEIAKLFNFNSLHTVRNYVSYLKQAYMLIGIQKYSQKSKIRITQEKIYAVDVALMNQRENGFAGENRGWRLETVVLSHLVRKCQREGWDVYYLKERSAECNFVVCNGNRVLQCIQVLYNISSEKTRKREVAGLLLANKQTKCENLLLLTGHEFKDIEKDGHRIFVRPVYEWVTSELDSDE